MPITVQAQHADMLSINVTNTETTYKSQNLTTVMALTVLSFVIVLIVILISVLLCLSDSKLLQVHTGLDTC